MATELGQAYVQIMPSARGISGKIKAAISPEVESAGQSAGLILLPLTTSSNFFQHFVSIVFKFLSR